MDCRSIYDLENKACREELNNYANMNAHCDPVRAKQVKNIDASANKMGLDYFVYSVCEECCDCIPRGASVGQYQMRKATGNLHNVNRGNCPAHAWFDICKIWPQVAFVSSPGQKDPVKESPPICPILTTWIRRPENSNWLLRSHVEIERPIKRFLKRFVSVAKCRFRLPWQSCVQLEAAQNRL